VKTNDDDDYDDNDDDNNNSNNNELLSIPVAAQSEAWVCDHYTAGIAVLNNTGTWDIEVYHL
jgi:hypothetical protein